MTTEETPGLNKKHLSVVALIPAFNEERTIAGVVVRLQALVNEVYVCDDGSEDMTGLISERLGAKVIRHSKNMGKGASLRSLFLAAREASPDMVVTLDGDGQHDPADIPRLIQAMQAEKAEVVVGTRFESGNKVPRHRRIGNALLTMTTAVPVSDTQSGFRAYSGKALSQLLPGEMGMGVDSEILVDAFRQGMKVVEIPVGVRYGIGKTSTHNIFYHTLDVFSSLLKLASIRHPLLFYGVPGLILFASGLYFAFQAFFLYNLTKEITTLLTTYGLVGLALMLFGALAIFLAIILFTVTTVVRKSSP